MCKKTTARNRTRAVLILAAVAMAILGTTAHQVSAAELTYEATVQVSENESVFNLSVFPGKAGYDNGTVSGVFGDGTIVDYRFFTADSDTVWSYADGGEGRVAPISSPPPENVAGPVNQSQNWPDLWITSDPDTDPADLTTNTQAGAQNITGTINISGLGKGILYFIHGTYYDPFTLSLTMSGPGQPDIQAEYMDDPPNTVNMGWVTSFTFSTAGTYNTITYSYTNTDADGSRARFMGVIVDGGDISRAQGPDPANEQPDVLRDSDLSWSPGIFAAQHNVYVGESFEDVNTATVPTRSGLDVNSFDPGRLDFGQTYYWRVDEVNAPPDSTIFKGFVWSFTTELLAYPIENVTVTASSSNVGEGAENTVNGSGVDPNDLHSKETTDMWRSSPDGDGLPWIEYEFDRVSKLHEMWIWNHNSGLEQIYGFGFKDVSVEYSVDGIDYKALGTTHEFAQAPGTPGYAHDTIDFAGAAAKYVRLTANSTWGSVLGGLSEVRFFEIPVHAKEPYPDSGATDVDLDVVLGWKAGREAVSHDVYISADPNALALAGPVTEPVFDTASLDLELEQDYHWRIDEVNDAETTTTWQGDIWNFTTVEFLVVDDFESYDSADNQIWYVWKDGLGYGTQDAPPYYAGNGTGSAVGDENTGSYTEETIVHGGKQSMPLFYDNSIASYSEVTANVADLQAGRDWTKHGIKALTLRFYGDPNNSVNEQMYVKIDSVKVPYDGDAENLTRMGWQMWYIDLASNGVNPSNVIELAIGFEPIGAVGGQGVVLLDDIRLYSYDRQLITPVDPGAENLVAAWNFDEGSGDIVTDNSGNGHNGTIVDATWETGKQGSALLFNGESSYVNIDGFKGINADRTDPNNPVQQAFTIAKWIKTTSGEGEMLTWGTNSGGQRLSWRLNGNTLRTEHGAGNLRGNTPVNDDEWHHVALVVSEGANLTTPATLLYLDGRPDSTFSGSDNPYELTADVDARIGMGAPTGGRFFTGLIDEVVIYDRALTGGEILWLAGGTKPFDKPF